MENKNHFVIVPPFNLAIVGPTKSGKTHLLSYMVTKLIETGAIHRAYVCAPYYINDKSYRPLDQILVANLYTKTYNNDWLKRVKEDIEESYDASGGEVNSLVILDDFSGNRATYKQKDGESLSTFMLGGRHLNVSFILLEHGWKSVPPLARNQIETVMFFNHYDFEEVRQIHSCFACTPSFSAFMRLLTKVKNRIGQQPSFKRYLFFTLSRIEQQVILYAKFTRIEFGGVH